MSYQRGLYLSYTGFKKLDSCAKSWELEYLQKKRPPFEDQRNVLKGNALHKLMEAYILGKQDDPRWFVDNAQEYWANEIKGAKLIKWRGADDEEKQRLKYSEWVVELARLFKKHDLQPTKLMSEFKADTATVINGTKIKLGGRIDVLMKTAKDDYLFLDLKGSERKEVMDFDQIVWYAYLVGLYLKDPSQPKFGGYILPGFQTLKIYRIPDLAKQRLEQRISNAIDTIESKEFPTNPSNSNCFFCPVKYVCPEFGGAIEHKSGIVDLLG